MIQKVKVIIIALVILNSCSTENIVNEDSIAKSLTFMKINLNELVQKENNINSSRICIVSWDEWGRSSRDCRGWGLCNAIWFECDDQRMDNYNPVYSSPLYFDETNRKHYIEILLASPTNIPVEYLTLKIDKSFELHTETIIGRNLIFNEGAYVFNKNLGSHGGIRIYLN